MTFVALTPPIYTNVMQYGAVGDGVTDDSTAITAALAAISPSTGGTLYFPPAHTFVCTGIDLSAYFGSVHILGGGWSTILYLKNATNNYMIRNSAGTGIGHHVSNLKIDCNSANQTGASGGIYGYKWRRSLIDFVWIHNPWQAGIFLTAPNNDFGYQNRIANCLIEGGASTTSGTAAYGEAIRLIYTDENHIYDNHFDTNGNPNDTTYGCHIYDQNGLSDYIGNSFVNGKLVLKFDGLQNRVIGNVFDGNGGASVQCNSSATNTIITGNTMLNVGYLAVGGVNNSVNGIYLNATQCKVSENWFQAAAGSFPYTNSFVMIDAGATYSDIHHNTFNVPATAGTVTPIAFVGGVPAGCRTRFNNGYNAVSSTQTWMTENYGSASITAGNTFVIVNHGLNVTPSLGQIQITPLTSLGAAAQFWITNATSTQFTINLNANPAGTVTFAWQIQTGY